MANQAKKLQVDVVARIDKLEKAMAKSAGVVDKQSGKMEKRLKKFSDTGNGYLANLGKGLVAGIAAGGIAGIVSKFGDVAKSVADIGRAAKQAGIDTRSFQELKYVAEQNRVGVDSLTDGIKELNLRADEFITTGKGSAAEAFGRLGYGASDLKKKLQDPSALFTEIIGKLGQLDKAAQIRIADEIFGGTGGEKFVQLISQGEAGIRATIAEAHKLGTVMTDEVIKSAEELDRKFNAITTSVGTGLKMAIVGAATELQKFINTFQGFFAEYDKRKNAAEVGAAMGSLAGKPLERIGANTTPKTNRLTPAPAALPSQEKLSADYLSKYRAELALTNQQRSIAAESERILSDAASRGLKVTKEQADALAREKVARDEGEASAKKQGAAREKAATQAAREAEQVRQLISDLEFERSLIGKTAVEKEKLNAIRDAGAAASDTEKAKIGALTEAIYNENKALQDSKDKWEDINNTARDVTGGIVSGLLDGASAADVFSEALKKISDTLLDDVLDSIFKVNQAGGSGGGLLGSIFGALGGGGFKVTPGAGLFSEGGYTGAGGKNTPAGVVHKGEYVIPKSMVDKMGVKGVEARLGGYANGGLVGTPDLSKPMVPPRMPTLNKASNAGGGGVVVNFNPVIDNRGASAEAVARTEQSLARLKAELPARVVMAVRDANKRNVKL
ncbi:tail tape measure protein [Phyllobacterium sp. SB3]|uniref:tail tape measure protein n=1 Tax=Phyllobacterium sp. SB3 TaxID=3156073 RepID=UPI0032AE9476